MSDQSGDNLSPVSSGQKKPGRDGSIKVGQATLKTRKESLAERDGRLASRADAILDAAEQVFATSGFAGASMREIANRAGVAQALIHYHFNNKEKLFEAVIGRRSGEINDRRGELLDALLDDPAPPRLEKIVEALFRPTIEKGHSLAKGGGSFSRILVWFANSSDERDLKLAETYYDPIARRFIEAFCRMHPHLSRADAVWAYMFSIGVGMTMMARTGRSMRLSNGECDDSDIETMLQKIVIYVCGGIRALDAAVS